MQETAGIQLGEIIAAIVVFGLMVSVPLILVFIVYKFNKNK